MALAAFANIVRIALRDLVQRLYALILEGESKGNLLTRRRRLSTTVILTSSPSLRELQLTELSMTKASMVVTTLNLLPRMETMTLGVPAVVAGNLI